MKAGDGAFAFNGGEVDAEFGFGTGAVDFDRAGDGVDEPAELGSVFDVFLELSAEWGETVRGRAEFDDEVGAEAEEGFLVVGGRVGDAGAKRPGGIGGATSSVRENETAGRVEGDTTAVCFGPAVEATGDSRVADGGPGTGGGHDEQFSLGGHLEI